MFLYVVVHHHGHGVDVSPVWSETEPQNLEEHVDNFEPDKEEYLELFGPFTIQRVVGPSHWDEDEQFPVEDWKAEVANDDVRSGYHDWVANQREQAEDDDS